MKYLTVTVPSYNSEDYLERCIDTLLTGGDRVEIIIVDDGSQDTTGAIADRYAQQFPHIVKVIHQENRGHGGAVNAGLAMATGRYFKIIDSDDWVDPEALKQVLERIDQWLKHSQQVDMLVCNYVYENNYQHKAFAVRYQNVFPHDRICGWNDTRHFRVTQYLIMHALIFDTEVLRKSQVQLPVHTFYVDTLFATQPLPFVERIYYLNVDFYHYFIGREDQSVSEAVMMKRIDQQIKVTNLVANCAAVTPKNPVRLARYVARNVSVMMAISSVHLLLIGTDEALDKREQLWQGIKAVDDKLYRKLRFHSVSAFTYLPTKLGGALTILGYRISRMLVKFQ